MLQQSTLFSHFFYSVSFVPLTSLALLGYCGSGPGGCGLNMDHFHSRKTTTVYSNYLIEWTTVKLYCTHVYIVAVEPVWVLCDISPGSTCGCRLYRRSCLAATCWLHALYSWLSRWLNESTTPERGSPSPHQSDRPFLLVHDSCKLLLYLHKGPRGHGPSLARKCFLNVLQTGSVETLFVFFENTFYAWFKTFICIFN